MLPLIPLLNRYRLPESLDTDFVVLLERPFLVTVSVTLNLPGANACVTLLPVAVAPSPKFHDHVPTGELVRFPSDEVPSKITPRPSTAFGGLAVKFATGKTVRDLVVLSLVPPFPFAVNLIE